MAHSKQEQEEGAKVEPAAQPTENGGEAGGEGVAPAQPAAPPPKQKKEKVVCLHIKKKKKVN